MVVTIDLRVLPIFCIIHLVAIIDWYVMCPVLELVPICMFPELGQHR